jgi:hypothetical protein
MKKLGFLMLLLAMAVMLGGTAFAQCVQVSGDPSDYFTTYYSNANTPGAPDATLRIINDGGAFIQMGGAPVQNGNPSANLYADIFVFDDSEELTECCSCLVTPDGLLSESVNKNLTANPLTGIKPTRGVIKVISDAATPPGNPTPGLRGWATHVQKLASGFAVTETLLADSNLVPSEEALLYQLCYYDGELSGKPCTCTPEDQDF